MPNHIQNRLQIIGDAEQVKSAFASIRADKAIEDGEHKGLLSPIDFNKIVPMHEDLNLEAGSLGETAYALLFGGGKSSFLGLAELQKRFSEWSLEQQKESIDIGLRYRQNVLKYGSETWYEWSIQNWGTKWNAYEVFDNRNTEDTIYFQTAWSNVAMLISKFSASFPELTFLYAYADEDTGSNTGRLTIKDGELLECVVPESGSKESYEIAFELRPHYKEGYELVGGNYKYIDEDEI